MAANRHLRGLPMRKVTVARGDLLEKLKANRVSHIENYNKAVVEYKAAALADIEVKKKAVVKALAELKAKLEKDPTSRLDTDETMHFDLVPPKSHEKDYDEIIAMFEMEVNDNVELDSSEFAQYVRDDWDWKGELENQRMFYASKSIGMAR